MYTQCPDCLSVFSLDADTLAKAHGEAVCGHCEARFDAMATLAAHLPPVPFELLPRHAATLAPPVLDLAVFRPRPAPAPVAAPEPAASAPDFSHLSFAPRTSRTDAERPARRRPAGPNRHYHARAERNWPWVLATLLLAFGLAAQLGWAKRDELVRDPVSGHWLREICATLGCPLPLVRAPNLLHLVASNVGTHPSVPGALMISASLRNDAAFGQPWPVIRVTLTDAEGRRIALRRLRPAEYLDDDAALARGLTPGASAVLLLEVEDPGEKAVGFALDFE